MNKVNEKNKKEFQRNKETINIKEFMLLKSGEQDKLIEETLNKVYEENVEVTKKHIDKVLNVAFDNKDNETFLPHSLCVQKDGNKLIFSFKKSNKALLILFLLGFLFVAGFATFSGVQLIGKSWMNIDLNGDGVPDLNLDLNDDGICEVNCTKNKMGKKPESNIDYRGNRKPTFNVILEDGTISNKMNQTDENGKCLLNCDTNDDGWPDTNIDIDGDGKADLNIDSDGDGNPDLNIDTNGDGVPDINIDEDGDGKCDINCDTNKDGKCDYNCDTNGDGKCDTKCNETEIIIGENFFIKDLIVLQAKDIGPGWNGSQTFKIINNTSDTVNYNLRWKNVINTFTYDNNLDYTITRNGNLVGTSKTPYIESNLLENETIGPNSEITYTINYEFKENNQNQNIDQGKLFSTNLELIVK